MFVDLLAVLVPAALVLLLAWRWPWRRRELQAPLMEAWLDNFSPDSYRPMIRLVAKRDAGFVLSRQGPGEAKRYGQMQRQILKEYLRSLSRDFHRLHSLATDSALRAQDDQGNSSLVLIEEKLEFIFSMWSIELRLLCSEVFPGAVDLKPLLVTVEQLAEKAREVARRRLDYRVS